jgi:PAS domain S-box-containing protein
MHDLSKTNQKLIKENALLKQRIQELEISEVEFKKTVEVLRQSEKRFRTIADYTPNWESWVDPDGKLIWVNPQVYDLLGYSEEECRNMYDYPMPYIHEDDKVKMRLNFKSALQGSSGKKVEFRIRCKDSGVKWAEVSWQPILDENGKNLGHRASISDITSRKQAEVALMQSEHIRSIIVRFAPIGMILISNRIIQNVNREMYKMTGYEREELIDKSIRLLFPTVEEFELIGGKKNKDFFKLGTGSIETRWICKDGRILDVLLNSAPLNPDNIEEGIILTAMDFTERKRAREELIRHRENLEIMVKERTAELEQKRTNLEELNAALKVLLRQREMDKDELEEKVFANIKELVMPYIQRLRKNLPKSKEADYVDILESNLINIVSPFSTKLSSKYLNLTPKEIQIANLIKEGKTSKDIAELLNMSPLTAERHRNNIRNKLNLKNKKENLRSYLLTIQ